MAHPFVRGTGLKKYIKKKRRQAKRKLEQRIRRGAQGFILILFLFAALLFLPQDIKQKIGLDIELDLGERLTSKEYEQTKEGASESVSDNEKISAWESKLEVHFLDVGQADATLLICDEHAMLIDAGLESSGTYIQFYLQKQGVKSLDYLILTHPDSDHIGGAPVIITKFDIDKIFMTDYTKDNRTYEKVLDALDYRNYLWEMPKVGETYALGEAEFTVLAPASYYEEPNNASLALRVSYGENSFLFTGDAEEKAELAILENGSVHGFVLESDVLKLGHHGSNTSTSQDFLNAVAPAYAVISCGKDNTYGFPHAEVLEKLEKCHIQVFRTDEDGEIIACSDGHTITWNCLENP